MKHLLLLFLLLGAVNKAASANFKAGFTVEQSVNKVNVKQFGAIGDGQTDDTNAILKAINNCTNGAVLFFPRGKYLLSQPLTINKNISITGDNAILKGACAIIFSDQCHKGNVSKLVFDQVAISIYCSNITIGNNKFYRQKQNAIQVLGKQANETNNIIVSNNTFNDIHPPDAALYNSSGRAIYVNTKGVSKNLKFVNNECTDVYGGSVVFLMGLVVDADISKNLIDRTSGQGIELFEVSPQSSGNINYNTITNCGILREKTPKGGVGCNGIYGLSVANAAINFKVHHNYINKVYENGIEGAFVLVADNTIINTGYNLADYPTPSPEGIFGAINIINNKIINPAGHGIYIFANADVPIVGITITGNIIQRDKITDGYSGIQINMKSPVNETKNVVIQNNQVQNFNACIYLTYNRRFNNIKITGNKAVNCRSFVVNYKKSGVLLKANYNNRRLVDTL